MDEKEQPGANEEEQQEDRKSLLFPQLRCLVALYVGYLGVSLGYDIFTGQVSDSALWVCAAAAVLFIVGAAGILIRDLPKVLKKQK